MDNNKKGESFSLRPYQTQVLKALSESNTDKKIVVLPTGAGKSIIISEYIKSNINSKLIVLTETKNLCRQLHNTLTSNGIKHNYISAGESNQSFNPDVCITLGMEQSLMSRLDTTYKSIQVDTILRDEIHIGFNGKRFNQIIDKLNVKHIIGLTATPLNEKGELLTDEYELINLVSTYDLIRDGYLCDYKITNLFADVSNNLQALSKADKSNSSNDYRSADIDKSYATDDLLNNMYNTAMNRVNNNAKVLVFVNSISTADRFKSMFKDSDAGVIHSKLSDEDNTIIMNKYKLGKIKVLISVSMITTGFDDTMTDTLILARPTKIKRLYVQMVGRGLRIDSRYRGKVCEIIDYAGLILEHGMPDDELTFKEASTQTIESRVKKLIIRGERNITRESVLNFVVNQYKESNDELSIRVNNLENENAKLRARLMQAENTANKLLSSMNKNEEANVRAGLNARSEYDCKALVSELINTISDKTKCSIEVATDVYRSKVIKIINTKELGVKYNRFNIVDRFDEYLRGQLWFYQCKYKVK